MKRCRWVVGTVMMAIILCLFETSSGWWIERPKPVCPLGYVEVRGCVPLEGLDHGAIKPFGSGGGPASPAHKSPPEKSMRPQPQTQPPEKPTPQPCPSGYHYSSLFGGCVFDKKPGQPASSPMGGPQKS